MKRILFSILGVAALLCCSCSKEEETIVNNEQNLETTDARGHMVFYSTTGRSAKVGMVSRKQQGFHKTDTVAIFEASAKRSLYTVDAAGSTLATGSSLYSSAKLTYYSGDALATGTTHYAVLPAKGAAWSGSNLSVVQNAAQYATPGSQDSTGCIHYGKTTTNAIAFSNLSAMFRLVVVDENTTCDEIRLVATGISGTATITLSSGAISAGSVDTVSCKAVGNGKFAKDTTYYYGFLPGTYTTLTATAYNGGSEIAGSAVTYSGKTWSSGAVYNIYLKGGKLYTKNPSALPAGCRPGKFSVSATTKVNFSMGNLQYQASTGTWQFAEHQWDYIGDDNANISFSYSGWIDLFCWGTSGYNSVQPYSTDGYFSGVGNLTGDNANYDWGVCNAIKNGGNAVGLWRTLTNEEWDYLISGRTNASKLNGRATVHSVLCLILLPDDWTLSSDQTYLSGTVTDEQWANMEAAGAVLLPAAGYRDGSYVYCAGLYGYYWSSTAKGSYAFHLYFSGYGMYVTYYDRYYGQSVRLVRNVN